LSNRVSTAVSEGGHSNKFQRCDGENFDFSEDHDSDDVRADSAPFTSMETSVEMVSGHSGRIIMCNIL